MHLSTTSYVNTAPTNSDKNSNHPTTNKCKFSASTCCPPANPHLSQRKAGRPDRLILRTRCSLSAIKQATPTYNNELCFFNQLHLHKSSVIHLQVRGLFPAVFTWVHTLSIVDSTFPPFLTNF